MKKFNLIFWILLVSFFAPTQLKAQKNTNPASLKLSLQKRIPSDLDSKTWKLATETQAWNPSESAIIICDMWDNHWCKGAAARVAEIAPSMNNVVSIAREKGITIIHAPSDCLEFYKNHPARIQTQKYRNKKAGDLISTEKLSSEKGAIWPIDQADGGCNCSPECKQGPPWPWTRQIDLIQISESDFISDSGAEIGAMLYQKGIKNVILMGVHTNMCVIGRSFGLRNMIRLGMNVVLMRDMTDTMYDSKEWPRVNHFTGNSLINEYIEKFVCPTMLSTDFTGKNQFRFREDPRQATVCR